MLETLLEAQGTAPLGIGEELMALYDGDLGFVKPDVVYANLVTSLDGVVALPGVPDSPGIISAHNPGDRFTMGLLRASAGAIIIGAGTLKDARRHIWTAEHVYRPEEASFQAFRDRVGLPPKPTLFVLSGKGDISSDHRVFEHQPVVIITSTRGALRCSELPSDVEVVALSGDEHLPIIDVFDLIRERAHKRILSEAGPRTVAQMLDARIVDELFLTLSPLVAGRGSDHRPGMISGFEFLPDLAIGARLMGIKRNGSHVFLRYAWNIE
ncbi:MAG: dihydrofolate reductase family protein [Actinobacteria bacterium]|nr:dihydrofolate reductase family protein [Actinomycetota bacterium]